jgi:thiamine biosynthesis lipoprotein
MPFRSLIQPLTGLLFSSLMSLAISPPLHADWLRRSENIMGTRVSVELWDDASGRAADCAQRVFDEMRRIDALMSPYRNDSEIAAINRDAAIEAVAISPELYALIERSLEFSRLSDGAFDISFASVGYRYDYRRGTRPDDDSIRHMIDNIDYRQIRLENGRIRFGKPGMRIDLGGIAKGHAVDRSIELLRKCGIDHALVSAGGDSRLLGDRNGRPWMIGIRHPRREDAVALRLPLENSAISTSGDYERFFISNGERVHHIINPRTGKSAGKSWSSTVIGPDATTTDALSTTLFILGAERGMKLIDQLDGLDAIIIDSTGQIHYSSGLMAADPSSG